MDFNGQVVGWVDIPHVVNRRDTYETAAWYTDYRVTPGRYLITAEYRCNMAYYCARIIGTVTDACFVSLYGGVPFGKDESGQRRIGTQHESAITWRVDFYDELADAMQKHGGAIRLFDEKSRKEVLCPVTLFAAEVYAIRQWYRGYERTQYGEYPIKWVGYEGHWFTRHRVRTPLLLTAGN